MFELTIVVQDETIKTFFNEETMQYQTYDQNSHKDKTKKCYTTVLQGVPVTSDRGALGWCTVSLIEKEGRKILFDTGSCGDRVLLLQRLREMGFYKKAIDAVFISHLHYDHCQNIELFQDIPVYLNERELSYVLDGEFEKLQDPFIPFTTIRHLRDRFHLVQDGSEIFPGLKVVALPGHTPGLSGLFLSGEKILFAGDGVKNSWEFINNVGPSAFYCQKAALKNYDWIRANAIEIVPGHDRAFRLLADGSITSITGAASVKLTHLLNPNDGPRILSLSE